MSDRMHGRPGAVSSITVRLGDRVMSLAVRAGQPSAEICREVRGVVLSRQPVAVQEWAAELARALVGYAEQNARTAEALAGWSPAASGAECPRGAGHHAGGAAPTCVCAVWMG